MRTFPLPSFLLLARWMARIGAIALVGEGLCVFIGNGNTAMVHHPKYDFNDEVIPYGVSYWAKLAETAMPLR